MHMLFSIIYALRAVTVRFIEVFPDNTLWALG